MHIVVASIIASLCPGSILAAQAVASTAEEKQSKSALVRRHRDSSDDVVRVSARGEMQLSQKSSPYELVNANNVEQPAGKTCQGAPGSGGVERYQGTTSKAECETKCFLRSCTYFVWFSKKYEDTFDETGQCDTFTGGCTMVDNTHCGGGICQVYRKAVPEWEQIATGRNRICEAPGCTYLWNNYISPNTLEAAAAKAAALGGVYFVKYDNWLQVVPPGNSTGERSCDATALLYAKGIAPNPNVNHHQPAVPVVTTLMSPASAETCNRNYFLVEVDDTNRNTPDGPVCPQHSVEVVAPDDCKFAALHPEYFTPPLAALQPADDTVFEMQDLPAAEGETAQLLPYTKNCVIKEADANGVRKVYYNPTFKRDMTGTEWKGTKICERLRYTGALPGAAGGTCPNYGVHGGFQVVNNYTECHQARLCSGGGEACKAAHFENEPIGTVNTARQDRPMGCFIDETGCFDFNPLNVTATGTVPASILSVCKNTLNTWPGPAAPYEQTSLLQAKKLK